MTQNFEPAEAAGLLAGLGVACETDAPLAPLTTFRIGGRAALLCRPRTVGELRGTLKALRGLGVRWYCLGKGSNTLFCDEGFDGAVVCFSGLDEVRVEGGCVVAGAGAALSEVCRAAQAAGLAGLEFAYGIPGSVGGAVFMNAGAYGGEMADVVQSVTCLDAGLELCERPAGECAFGYRTSVFQTDGSAVVQARFALQRGDPAEIDARMRELLERRRSKQPLEYPSAGSTFKRPQGAYAAALIEQCGLKGTTVGGAQVSEKHGGFLINIGGATCADVLALADLVCRTVEEKTGFHLEKEIRVVR